MRTAEAEETACSGMWASITLSLYQFRNALLCCSIHSVGKTMALLSLRLAETAGPMWVRLGHRGQAPRTLAAGQVTL